MLVEMRLVEQRYQAVLELLNDGASVVEVARRSGVARRRVHGWLRQYAGRVTPQAQNRKRSDYKRWERAVRPSSRAASRARGS